MSILAPGLEAYGAAEAAVLIRHRPTAGVLESIARRHSRPGRGPLYLTVEAAPERSWSAVIGFGKSVRIDSENTRLQAKMSDEALLS